MDVFQYDSPTELQRKVFEYYKLHPNTSWVQAAESLGVGEEEAVNASFWLQMRHYVIGTCEPSGQALFCFAPKEMVQGAMHE